jgi:hypothetical protein
VIGARTEHHERHVGPLVQNGATGARLRLRRRAPRLARRIAERQIDVVEEHRRAMHLARVAQLTHTRTQIGDVALGQLEHHVAANVQRHDKLNAVHGASLRRLPQLRHGGVAERVAPRQASAVVVFRTVQVAIELGARARHQLDDASAILIAPQRAIRALNHAKQWRRSLAIVIARGTTIR